MNIIKHNIRAILLILLNAAIIIFYFYFLQHLKKIEAETLANQQIIASSSHQQEEVSALKKSLASRKEDQATLNSYFTDNDHVVSVLDSIEGFGDPTGTAVSITSVDISRSKLATLKISLKATGSFEGVFRLSKMIENLPYETNITSVNFSEHPADAGKNSPPVWEGSYGIEITSFNS
jgi:Tfp pilus assembly protein PilO